MEIKIYNGRKNFFQWDTDQKLIVEDTFTTELHLTNEALDNAIVVECYEDNGIKLCDIPNSLLQTSGILTVYAFTNENGNYTKEKFRFFVYERKKPDNYVAEEDKPKWSELENRIEKLESNDEDVALELLVECDVISPIANNNNVLYTNNNGKIYVL